jgi:hypothetical protein
MMPAEHLAIIRQALPHSRAEICHCPGCYGASLARKGVRVQGRNHAGRVARAPKAEGKP